MSDGLEARGLHRTLGGRAVLRGVDLDVQPGEVVGLLGPNGAGKTTCFRILVGLDQADGGTVHLAGQALDGLALWQRVRLGLAYLAQEPTLFRDLSVVDNLRLAVEGGGGNLSDVGPLLAAAGLEHLASHRAGTLSGGERRRLEFARCRATRPRVVLLDEPFAGVDPIAVADLQARIRAMADHGLGVLLTDHAVQAALPACDRAVLLDMGEVMVSGTPEDVAADPHARSRYLGADFVLPRRPPGPATQTDP